MNATPKCTVLIVDDQAANIDVLVGALRDAYQITVARDGKTALEVVADSPPDLILLDIIMPGMNGYEVCRRLKSSELTRVVPVIFLTALADEADEAAGLALGAVDYITKPFNPALVKARIRNNLELKRHRDHLEELVTERTREAALAKEVTIDGLATLAEYRDPETGGHIQRTKNYVRVLAEALRRIPRYQAVISETVVDRMHKCAALHDIGKVGVRDSILLKPGSLTKEEFVEMKRHTEYGANAIQKTEEKLQATDSFLAFAREIAWTHHERWDGTGYPRGLRTDEIPLSGRIMALADVYDALISRRVYKPPFSHHQALEIIRNGDGRTLPCHFDPEVLAVFIDQERSILRIASKFADSDEEKRALTS